MAKQTRVVVPDMLGYGQSDKPVDGNYSIFKSADMFEAIAKEEGLRNAVLVIHDLGQTVGAELMMRQEEGKLCFNIQHAIVFNGSTLVNMVQINDLQKNLLAMPDEPLKEDMPRESFYKGLRGTFSKEHAASDETMDVMVAQIYEKHGSRLMPRLIRYLTERHENLQRWTDGRVEASMQRRTCPATGTSVGEAWEAEKHHLGRLPHPLPEPFDLSVQRRVGRDATVRFEGRTYSVPFRLAETVVERITYVGAGFLAIIRWQRSMSSCGVSARCSRMLGGSCV